MTDKEVTDGAVFREYFIKFLFFGLGREFEGTFSGSDHFHVKGELIKRLLGEILVGFSNFS